MEAFAARPRATALFLLSIAHWDARALLEAHRWEKALLAKVFRFRRRNDESRMFFNKRCADKLQRWFAIYSYKPMHTCILERVYRQVWHERTTASEIRAVRVDRGHLFWGAIKDVSYKKRQRHGAAMHSRAGPHGSFDGLFFKAWGAFWRDRLHECTQERACSDGCEEFVKEACLQLGLPTSSCREKVEGEPQHIPDIKPT